MTDHMDFNGADNQDAAFDLIPANTLVRVTLESASEADTLFTLLMGEDVERRRAYIEKHALEVKNLDV